MLFSTRFFSMKILKLRALESKCSQPSCRHPGLHMECSDRQRRDDVTWSEDATGISCVETTLHGGGRHTRSCEHPWHNSTFKPSTAIGYDSNSFNLDSRLQTSCQGNRALRTWLVNASRAPFEQTVLWFKGTRQKIEAATNTDHRVVNLDKSRLFQERGYVSLDLILIQVINSCNLIQTSQTCSILNMKPVQTRLKVTTKSKIHLTKRYSRPFKYTRVQNIWKVWLSLDNPDMNSRQHFFFLLTCVTSLPSSGSAIIRDFTSAILQLLIFSR